LYQVIAAFEMPRIPIPRERALALKEIADANWQEFINATYGSLADAPIIRGDQGKYEMREEIK